MKRPHELHIALACGSVVLASASACDAQDLLPPPLDLSALSQDLELGPLKLTFGPQEGGDFGAVLTGDATRPVPSLGYIPPPEQQNAPFRARYGAIEFNVDAGWNSAADALNQTTLAVRPSVTFAWLDGAKQAVPLTPAGDRTCRALAAQGMSILERPIPRCAVTAAPGHRSNRLACHVRRRR